MASLQDLETALVNADKAGDSDAARRLAVAVRDARAAAASAPSADRIPGMGAEPAAAPSPTLSQRAVGTGEAALATITSPFAYLNGLAAGGNTFVKRLLAESFGAENPEQYDPGKAFEQASQAAQYTPRTAQGQEQAGAVADAMQGLAPLAGLTGEAAALGQAMRAGRAGATLPTTARATAEGVARDAGALVSPAAGETAAAGVGKAIDAAGKAPGIIRDAAASLPARTRELIFGAEEAPAAGTMGSAGAAGTDLATQRATTAESLPVPIKLTQGQRTRDFAQQRFEQETAKDPSLGASLRENSARQNQQLAQNFEAMIDNVGATAPDMRETGRVVDSALVKAAADSKREYRAKYQAADKAGELRTPVNLDALVDHLNQSAPEASTAPLINTARNLAIKLGIAKDEGGQLVPVRGGRPNTLTNEQAPNNVTLKTAETFRQAINRNIDTEPTNIRQGTIIKQLIDQATENQGGDLYKGARAARQRHAQLFEDNAIVSDLLATRRNTADRRVALEDVFNRTILNGDRESLGMLRRTLDVSDQRAGIKPGTTGEGAQAWRELQGATLRHLLTESTKGVATDVAGNPIFSAAKLNNAVNALDRGGRLDFVLGKKNAQLVRDLNEVAKVVLTAPPGAVNTSNTASVVLAAIAEAGATGALTGLPLPVLSTLRAGTQFVKDVKVRRRVEAALNPNGRQRPQP
ncbi:MAG TPA: hypothetical protein VIN03_11950 [Roseateles sp.]